MRIMLARILRCFMFVLFAAATLRGGQVAAAEADVSIVPRDTVRLEARGAERPIELRALGITSAVTGRFAMTTVEMTFFNPNSRVLEGELQFPLTDGQTVTGFALSMRDGKKEIMREAVPVDKAKGRRTFEAIERRNVDPALLEVTQGNNFKLRVYPLDPGGERRVRVTYGEALPDTGDGVLYRLPLAYADKIGRLDIRIRAEGVKAPSVRGITAGGSGFEVSRTGEGAYSLALSASDVSPGVGELAIPFGRAGEDGVHFGRRKDKTYFYAEVEAGAETASDIRYPKTLSILWDASASGRSRDRAREFAFLGAFFAAAKDVTVDLQRVRDTAAPRASFEVKGGDWSALRDALAETVYDGATNLGAFDTGAQSDMFFLFSDGLDNYSSAPLTLPAGTRPLYALVSSVSADAARLKFLSANGGVIDLRMFDPARDTISGLLAPRAGIISASGPGVSDVVWSRGARGVFRLAGVVNGPDAKLTLTFESPSGEPIRRDISLDSAPLASVPEGPASDSVPFMWAAMKIESLDGEYDLNRGEIRRVGREFGIPTRETSLMVLETAEDYARYDIDPPSDLKPEFDRLRALLAPRRADRHKLGRIVSEWKSRVDWWEKDFPKGPMPGPGKNKPAPDVPNAMGNMMAREEERPMARAYAGSFSGALFDEESQGLRADGVRSEPLPAPVRETADMTIALRSWNPDEPYIRRMKEAGDEDLYRIYLDERPDYEDSAPFFVDVSYQLSGRGFEELSLRVLSNLAEMNLESRQILRVLGYRLLEAGRAEQAVVIFKQVLAMADDEPQSYRDLALALDAAGDKQSAVDRLYDIVERDFERDFPGIEIIALTEMNAIIASSSEPLDTSKIDPRLRGNYPLDLRVVITWDTDNTDVDLLVTDPNGEEAFYGAPLSYQGGRVSPDNTVGYGPEEYSLKKAKPGVYRIEAIFYANSQQSISDATTVQLDFFTGYGGETQKKESVTMRLRDAKDRIFVGEFEVK
jgi:tetratricopeptide (TPR) repeat protein